MNNLIKSTLRIRRCRCNINWSFKLIKPLTLIFSLLMASIDLYSAPSFDCQLAGTRIEKLICLDNNQDLQVLDLELSKIYRARLKASEHAFKQFLKNSQISWVKHRDRSCLKDERISDETLKRCLIKTYSFRNNELEHGVIVFHVNLAKHGKYIVFPERKIVLSKKSETIEESQEFENKITTTSTYFAEISHNGKSQVVNLGTDTFIKQHNQIDHEAILGIRILHVPGVGLVFSINRHLSNDTVAAYATSHSESYEVIMSEKNGFSKNRVNLGGHSGSPQYVSSSFESSQWSEDVDGALGILQTRIYYPSHINQIGQVSTDFYRFDKQTGSIKEVENYILRELEERKSDNAHKYFHLADGLLEDTKEVTVKVFLPGGNSSIDTQCTVSERALNKARYRVILALARLTNKEYSREQLLYALTKLFVDYRSKMPEEFMLLANELLVVKLNIESIETWKIDIRNAYSKWELHETFVKVGFPRLPEGQCRNFATLGYDRERGITGPSLNDWLYGFWQRRYNDGTFEEVSRALEFISNHERK